MGNSFYIFALVDSSKLFLWLSISSVMGIVTGKYIKKIALNLIDKNGGSHLSNTSILFCDQLTWKEMISTLTSSLFAVQNTGINKISNLKFAFVEVFSSCLFVSCIFASPTIASNPPEIVILLSGWVLASILLLLTLIDIHTLLLPDIVCKPGILLGLLVSFLVATICIDTSILYLLYDRILAISIGYFSFELLLSLSRFLLGKKALGHGDSKFVALIGSWLGVKGMILAIMLAFIISGTLLAIALIAGRIKPLQVLPFGPFLSLGCFLVWFFGNQYWSRYLLIS